MVHLFVNIIDPTVNTVLADLVESTNPGLVGQLLPAPVDTGIDGTGRDEWIWPLFTFRAGAAPLPVVVYGWWIDFVDPITAQRVLLAVQQFGTPFAFLAVNDPLPLNLGLGGTQC